MQLSGNKIKMKCEHCGWIRYFTMYSLSRSHKEICHNCGYSFWTPFNKKENDKIVNAYDNSRKQSMAKESRRKETLTRQNIIELDKNNEKIKRLLDCEESC